jgi:hypothetical protein
MALDKNQIAKRIAQEVKDGYYVNLGIGIPTLVANYVRTDISVEFQSENGVLGMGPFHFEGEEDADIINAGKQTRTTLPGASFFDSAFSFGMIRAQKVDLTISGFPNGFISKFSTNKTVQMEINKDNIFEIVEKYYLGKLTLQEESDFERLFSSEL